MKKRVYAYPKAVNRRGNPFNYIVYEAVERAGWEVREYIPSTSFFHPPAVLHVHWLESLYKYGPKRSRFHVLRFMGLLLWMKAWGTKVVWTLHNLKSHDGWHPRLERRLQDFLARHADRIISLSQAGLGLGKARFPSQAKKFVCIPHPHYGDYFDAVAETPCGLESSEHFTFLFLGQVRPYKGILDLIEAFEDLKDLEDLDRSYRLIIAGAAPDPEHARLIEERIGGNARIDFLNRFIPEEEVPDLMRKAHAGVLPYRDILNSGTALLFASFGLPIVGPRLGALPELVETIEAGFLYSPESGGLREAMERAATQPVAPGPIRARVQQAFDPREVGQAHALLYETLCGR